ncbi:GDYXXLXY domain-containing protein [Paenibacillus silviterrae]|jgi:uncharacterized membrane-anchored protein|uniref:GDYXXLXY domain-containing protein n=1 Tax=Paenibacillus silviterrae TaxID=3242194 RepID=UPI002543433D|nr:GDYXXLXY domain-containing protein [Paenibacillus chinjuensis]
MNRESVTVRRRPMWMTVSTMLQLLVLAGIAISYYAVGWFGQDVRLKTVPVDPRDILYGDYVTLSYDISRLSPSLWKEGGELPQPGTPIYVVVRQGPMEWAEVVGAYRSEPAVAEGEVVIKGRVDYSWDEEIRVDYGIERYYVPENTGKVLEDKADRLTVKLKVAPWGQAKIEGIEERK